MPCFRDVGCTNTSNADSNTSNADSVRNCCVQEGVLSVQLSGRKADRCQLCYGMLKIMYKKHKFVEY